MYPPPNQTILKKLLNGIIDSISFYRFQTIISCENGDAIVIYSPFCFRKNTEAEQAKWIEFPITHTEMTRILGSEIVEISTDSNHSLLVKFSTDDTLLVSWTDMYESYEILIEGERMIV